MHETKHRVSKSRTMRRMEVRLGKPIETAILDAAIGTRHDYEIAYKLDLIPPTLSAWIARLGLRDQINQARRTSNTEIARAS